MIKKLYKCKGIYNEFCQNRIKHNECLHNKPHEYRATCMVGYCGNGCGKCILYKEKIYGIDEIEVEENEN